MATMRAIVKARPEPGLRLEEVPVPEAGINDVLIRVHKTAICGTDVHIYDWNDWARRTIHTPLVIGHEFAGTVAAVGSNVRSFKPGDVASGEGHIVCGLCRNCLAGRRHLCAHTAGVGVNRPGAFAEYLCIPAANVWGAAPTIPLELLAYFDPLGNATHTALSFDLVGEDILTGTFGKALGGASGGYTAGRQEITDHLRQRSRPYLFSNTLAPVIAATTLKALELVASRPDLRARLDRNTRRFRGGMARRGFRIRPGEHPIVPVMLGDAHLAGRMAEALLAEGVYVIGFSYPVVPKGAARVRVQMSAALEDADIDFALEKFAKAGRELGVI